MVRLDFGVPPSGMLTGAGSEQCRQVAKYTTGEAWGERKGW